MATAWESKPKSDSLGDVTCPTCLEVLIESITLQCGHNFCSRCIETSNHHNNLTCPICRLRCGGWLRTTNSPVNSELWKTIQEKFPKEVEKKYKDVVDKVPPISKTANKKQDKMLKEQKKNEETLRQEKEDFELACKLQAEFDIKNGTRRALRSDGSIGTSQPEN